jgi:hypothetical protein
MRRKDAEKRAKAGFYVYQNVYLSCSLLPAKSPVIETFQERTAMSG